MTYLTTIWAARVISAAAPFHSAEAAPERVRAVVRVSRRRPVGHAKWAFHAVAIGGSAIRVLVAKLAVMIAAA